MKLSSRLTELAKHHVSYSTRPLTEEDKQFSGEPICRFEQGEGIEYVPDLRDKRSVPKRLGVKPNNGLYLLLVAEVGSKKAQAVFENDRDGATIETETHVILDFKTGLRHQFIAPSRIYCGL